MSATVRVRFAPSPTGNLHIGGARTALFNWAFARGRDGVFVLRVEDTDRERSTPAFESAILDGLAWLGIDWDEGPDRGGPHGPYRQSERDARYRERLDELLAAGHAYRCFCSAERLAELREAQQARKETSAYDRRCAGLEPEASRARARAGEPCVVRFRVPAGETRVDDRIRGEVVFANAEVDDWIMARTDGSPTYNFVVVCDDLDMRITHVLRGEEHLVNTPKQVLLYAAFGHDAPVFAHLPLMLGTDGKKLSKRTGDTALQEYRDKGFPPEAVVNFLCLQGWALDGATEVFSREQLVEAFDLRQVSKGGAVFDLDKFLWLAGEYIRTDSAERVAERCTPYVVAAGLADADELARRATWFVDVVRTWQERIRLYSELPARIAFLFAADEGLAWDPKAEQNARKHAAGADTLEAFGAWLDGRLAAGATTAALRDESKAWLNERGLKIPVLFQPLRLALSGQAGGPDLFDLVHQLGRERTAARIRDALARLRA